MAQSGYFRWHGDEVERRVRRAAVNGLDAAAEHLLGLANAIIPLEEGTLLRSGTTTVDESSLTAGVSYDTVYAVRQHEELTWRHAPGRSAKYLEGPADAASEELQAIVAAHIRRASR